ncbi:MAG: DUF268 domain-containing protein [Chloroflexota bacterium]
MSNRTLKTFVKSRNILWLYRWGRQVLDPVGVVKGLTGWPQYYSDLKRYTQMPGAEPVRLRDTFPQLHDRTTLTPFGGHYFYTNGWATRRILANQPKRHTDIGSQVLFANLLAASVPVTFLDYRPLNAALTGLESLSGDILRLPFASNSIKSLSCLHVAEHIGLGRYGDALNPYGTKNAADELTRVLAPRGYLYFAVPVGKPRLQFNAHRVHAVETIRDYFADLELVELSGLHDDDQFMEHVGIDEFDESQYACGMFLFRKQSS